MKNNKRMYCNKCKMKTEHDKVGFGSVGGFIGNARWRCSKCKKETRYNKI